MLEVAYLLPYEREYGKWYRSKDIKGDFLPFISSLINKKWWLEEELNNHLLQFQQVLKCRKSSLQSYSLIFQAYLIMKEMPFKEEEEEEPLEPLRMEHFHFPLLLLAAGLVLSALSFTAEILIFRIQGGKR